MTDKKNLDIVDFEDDDDMKAEFDQMVTDLHTSAKQLRVKGGAATIKAGMQGVIGRAIGDLG